MVSEAWRALVTGGCRSTVHKAHSLMYWATLSFLICGWKLGFICIQFHMEMEACNEFLLSSSSLPHLISLSASFIRCGSITQSDSSPVSCPPTSPHSCNFVSSCMKWSGSIRTGGDTLRNCEGGRSAHLCSSTLLHPTPACSFWLLICLQQYFYLSACVAHTHASSSPFIAPLHSFSHSLPLCASLLASGLSFWRNLKFHSLTQMRNCIFFGFLYFYPPVCLLYLVSPHTFSLSLLPKLMLLAHPPTLMAPVFISVCLYNLYFINSWFECYFKLYQHV